MIHVRSIINRLIIALFDRVQPSSTIKWEGATRPALDIAFPNKRPEVPPVISHPAVQRRHLKVDFAGQVLLLQSRHMSLTMAITIMFHPAVLDACSPQLLTNRKRAAVILSSTASVKIKPQIRRDLGGAIQTFIMSTPLAAAAAAAAVVIMSVTFPSWWRVEMSHYFLPSPKKGLVYSQLRKSGAKQPSRCLSIRRRQRRKRQQLRQSHKYQFR